MKDAEAGKTEAEDAGTTPVGTEENELEYEENRGDSSPAHSHASGMGIGLSGGGYRAALLHLGALRRLNELGLLSRLDTVSCVSGGSITGAFLADRVRPWPTPNQLVFEDWEAVVSRPFHAIMGQDMRTGAVLKSGLPWNWLNSGARVEALAMNYERAVTRLRLGDLPEHPRFVFCAADMTFGANWIFEKVRVGDYQAGYVAPPPDWPVARAVAASSCFPPIFRPLRVNLDPAHYKGGQVRKGSRGHSPVKAIALTDGGVYDNMGMEPVWKKHRAVFVSDGGSPFGFQADGAFQRLLRYTGLLDHQVRALRKRMLMAAYSASPGAGSRREGAYWGVGSTRTMPVPLPPANIPGRETIGYSRSLVEDILIAIRTDLDAFSGAECAVLENHGYIQAAAAIDANARHLAPLPNAALDIPHPAWMDEKRVRRALAESHKVRFFGRR